MDTWIIEVGIAWNTGQWSYADEQMVPYWDADERQAALVALGRTEREHKGKPGYIACFVIAMYTGGMADKPRAAVEASER